MKATLRQPNLSLTGRTRTLLVACTVAFYLLFMAPQATSHVHAQDVIIHVVVAGDSLTSIARRYNVSVSALMNYNNIGNANLIRPNQQIRIPTTIVQPPPTNAPAPVAAIENNPTATSESIPATQTGGRPASTVAIQTPVPTSTLRPTGGPSRYTATGEPVYTVRRGDTLSGIASQYGVTVTGIMQRNGLGSHSIIVSQRIIIPIGTAAPSPTSTRQTSVNSAQAPVAWPTATPAIQAIARTQPEATGTPHSQFLITATPTPRLR